MTNRVHSRIVDVKLSVSCVYANFSYFYLRIFCLKIFCLFKCPFKLLRKVFAIFW